MKNFMLTTLILFSSCFLFAGCEKELPEDAVYDPRYPETDKIVEEAKGILGQADFIFMRENFRVEIYYQTKNDNAIKLVSDYENRPDNLKSVFNVIRNKEGNIMYVAEFLYGESGEWENTYEHIFNSEGDLLVFVRKSSFLQNDTLNKDVVIYEKSEYYYNRNHKLLKKNYLMKYANQNQAPLGVKVEFPYRFEYKQYKTRKKWLKAHDLDK